VTMKTELRKKPRRKESEIQRAILDYLKLRGIMACKVGSVNVTFKSGRPEGMKGRDWDAGGSNGVPDILGILPGGRALCIEVKGAGARITPAQARYIEAAAKRGALAFVAHSVEEVKIFLDNAGVK